MIIVKKYTVQDLNSGEYFVGCNPMPLFCKESWREFDSEQEALDRITSEINDCPDYFAGRDLVLNTLSKIKPE